jgi:hypothetical protein
MTQSNLRREERTAVNLPVLLVWADSHGGERCLWGRCTNVSESGLRLQLHNPVPTRLYVNFRIDLLRLNGSGSVRYCRREGDTFATGIEFSGGLKWVPPGQPRFG